MKLPEMSPENHEEIFEFFRNVKPNPIIQKLGFLAARMAYGSRIEYLGESYSDISQHREDGGNLIVVANHQSNADLLTIAGLGLKGVFNGLAGNTTAPGKIDMFRWPVLRKLFVHLGVHSTTRFSDFTDTEKPSLEDLTPEEYELWEANKDETIEFNQDYLNKGGHIFVFPESRRNTRDYKQLQKVKVGVAQIALGLNNPENTLIAPIAINYRTRKIWKKLKLLPKVVVHEPFCPAGMTEEQIRDRIGYDLQETMDVAFDLAA